LWSGHKRTDYFTWLLILELFTCLVALAAFVCVTTLAIELEPFCPALDLTGPLLKRIVKLVADKLGGIFNICPISKGGAAAAGLLWCVTCSYLGEAELIETGYRIRSRSSS
jgi:hypothetical protein